MKTTLFILLLIFNALDVWQTHLLLEVGLEEWNPIVECMIQKFGFFYGVIGFKAFWLVFLGVLLVMRHAQRK